MSLLLTTISQLIDAIGAGCSPDDSGPIVLTYQLWDGRTAQASYYRGDKDPDAIFREDVVLDDRKLQPLAEKLLGGESFIIETGSHDMVCTLEWTIM